ncbi:MAG: carotenoid biosynthesis protein [Actinobacteria bacterium]|nr:carotenoid biosynthesis protein [Actinomycetota bacterium]
MSIRHYSPRGNRRRGISFRARTLLGLILGVAIVLQISYPLLDGEALRIVTISTVYWSAGAMALHALLAYGLKYAYRYLGATVIFAFLIELMGVKTGWPFGTYSYDASLGRTLAGVPFVVPFAWVMMAHPLLVAARRVSGSWVFLYGGFALAAWDLFLDPQMVSAGRWHWTFTGAHVPFQPEIPLSNAFGWLLAGMALMAILNQILPRDRRRDSASFGATDFYLAWTYFAGIVSNVFFFSRPGVALIGGICFGAIWIPYVFSRWLGRP